MFRPTVNLESDIGALGGVALNASLRAGADLLWLPVDRDIPVGATVLFVDLYFHFSTSILSVAHFLTLNRCCATLSHCRTTVARHCACEQRRAAEQR